MTVLRLTCRSSVCLVSSLSTFIPRKVWRKNVNGNSFQSILFAFFNFQKIAREHSVGIATAFCTYLWTLKSIYWRCFPAMCECLCSGHAQWDTECHVIWIWGCWSKISRRSCNWRSSLQKLMCEKISMSDNRIGGLLGWGQFSGKNWP